MRGNKGRGAKVLTARDLRLLSALVPARIIDRELAKQIAGFGSTTRANSRLLALTVAIYLNRFFVGTRAGGVKALYALSKKGAAAIQSQGNLIHRKRDSLLVGDLFIEHQLAINSIWIQAMHRAIPVGHVNPLRWLSFRKALSKQIPIIPDGYFELEHPSGVHPMFLEVDRGTETLKVWDKKIALYLALALSGEFRKMFGHHQFRVLVAASSDRRLENIRKQALKHTDKIFWFATLEDINQRGLFQNIWLRPSGRERLALL